MKVALQAAGSSLIGLVLFGLLLFLPAGTFDYWQAWVFIAVFTISTTGLSIYLLLTNPAVLQRRMHAGPAAETRTVQKIASSGLFMSFAAVMVLSALDHRFGWSPVPTVVSLAGNVLVVLGLGIGSLVVIQNSYAAANITVEEDQEVVSTGLYGIVRHPMYLRSCSRSASPRRRGAKPRFGRIPRLHAEGSLPVGAVRVVIAAAT